MNELISPDLVREVLAAWSITPDHVFLISAKGNLHWRVQAGRDNFVLRMYKRPQTIASIQYELDILAQLAERRWPVAAAIDGVVQHSGIPFALFPLLPGDPAARRTISKVAVVGAPWQSCTRSSTPWPSVASGMDGSDSMRWCSLEAASGCEIVQGRASV